MFESRSDEYKTSNFIGTRELRLKKLRTKLREHIRLFHNHPVLSDAWIRMSDSVSQVSEVSFMEMTVPFKSDTKVNHIIGRKEDGTLWDQEDDQLAIKILLEEGKINLCMRLLDEYKTRVTNKTRAGLLKLAAENSSFEIEVIDARMDQFEKGIGIILNLAIEHEEVLQILDIPTFIAFIGRIIKNALDREDIFKPRGSSKFVTDFNGHDKFPECQVFFYLASIGKFIETMDEERIIALLDQFGILPITVNHIAKYHKWYACDVLKAALVFWNLIFDTETFTADKGQIVSSCETKRQCIFIFDELMPTVLEDAKMSRKDVKAFSDNCKSWKFEMKQE